MSAPSRLPTVGETFRNYMRRELMPKGMTVRGAASGIVFLIALLLILPPPSAVESTTVLWFFLAGVTPSMIVAAQRESKMGGPRRLEAAAALAAGLSVGAVLAFIVSVWRLAETVGFPHVPKDWIPDFSSPLALAVFLVVVVCGLAVTIRRELDLDGSRAAFDDEARAERFRRKALLRAAVR